jgi:hypothetical protein
MEESYSSPVEPIEDCHSNPGGVTDRTVENLKDLRRKTRGPIIDNSFMNYLLIGL